MKIPNRKRCSKCRILKPLSEFPPCKTGKFGLYNYCRDCHRQHANNSHPNRVAIDESKIRKIGLKKQGLKTCGSCKIIRPIEDFYSDPRHSDGKQTYCKDCCSQRQNGRYILKEYGITLDEFRELMDAQDGVCAICGRPPKHNKFNVDHDHKTNKIRALLCVNCNTNLLPYVERFPEWVKKAFVYLENPPAFKVIGEREVPETNQARSKRHEKRLHDK